MSATAPQLSFREVLRLRPVRTLWIAQLISVFGDFLAVFAVFDIVTFQLHGTPTQVAFILVSYMLPLAIVSPIAGVYVDLWNVKLTMIGSDLIRAGLVLILLFSHNLYAIYGALFLLSVVSSFFIPAQSVAIRVVTPTNGLLAANGLMQQAIQGSLLLAPALTGLLVGWLGSNACFGVDLASFLASASLVFTVTIDRVRASKANTSAFRSMAEGLRFIFTHAQLTLVILSMAAGMFAMRLFGSLFSVYVRDILHSSDVVFDVLNSLIGIGMIVGAQSLPRFARTSAAHRVSYALVGMGAGVLFTTIFTSTLACAIGMIGMGYAAAFVMVSTQTLIQQETPHEMIGRVTSVLMSLLSAAQIPALIAAGPVSQFAGIRTLYFASAAGLILAGAAGYYKLRSPAPSATAATSS
jgi:MFS family permease